MHILCLHGFGTSGSIMERQFAPFCDALDESYEFTFLDGEVETQKPKELTEFVPGPFLCYYKAISPSSIQEALDSIAAAVAEDGPFDGVVAFSQGAAIVMSYLLHLETTFPGKPLPFKWAALFSPVVPISPDPDHLKKDIEKFEKFVDKDDFSMDLTPSPDEKLKKAPKHRVGLVLDRNKRALGQEIVEIARAILTVGAEYVDTSDITAKLRDGTQTVHDLPRIYHPLLTKKRVSIPTVFVVGRRDNPLLLKQAQLARRLCAPDYCTYIEHGGAHDIPRNPAELAKVVAAVEAIIKKSQFTTPRWPRF